ncbi:MAG: hypothetical protein KAH44_29075 [Oricola sp.]|nr:hypothetical protein [Oricola sp.]
MNRLLAAAAAFYFFSGAGALAQSGDEIVVTGSRLQRYAADVVPTVALNRNADFVLITYNFVCDTRDAAQRRRELTRTLEGLIAAAGKRDDIELSTLVEYEDDYDTLYFPKPYEAVDTESFSGQYGRADTSLQTIVIKTPAGEGEASLDAAAARIKKFVGTLKMEGRTIAEKTGDTQLSIVNVERYRAELTAAIRTDAERQSAALGAGKTEISGLEQVVRWERSRPLELKIYIPYKLAFTIDG